MKKSHFLLFQKLFCILWWIDLFIISVISHFLEIWQGIFNWNFCVISAVHTSHMKSRKSDLLFSVYVHYCTVSLDALPSQILDLLLRSKRKIGWFELIHCAVIKIEFVKTTQVARKECCFYDRSSKGFFLSHIRPLHVHTPFPTSVFLELKMHTPPPCLKGWEVTFRAAGIGHGTVQSTFFKTRKRCEFWNRAKIRVHNSTGLQWHKRIFFHLARLLFFLSSHHTARCRQILKKTCEDTTQEVSEFYHGLNTNIRDKTCLISTKIHIYKLLNRTSKVGFCGV
jgi:hypothetical protein